MADTTNAFFSRRVPFYLLDADSISDSEGFDAYPVEVDVRVLNLANELRELAKTMNETFDMMPAPEESAQDEADILSVELLRIAGAL